MTQKRYRYFIIIGIITLALSSIAGAVIMLSAVGGELLNQTGIAYNETKEQCGEFVASFFDGEYSRENVKTGLEALRELGYTDRGIFFIIKQMGLYRVLIGLIIVQAVILVAIFVCIYLGEKKRHEAEQERERRINELERLKSKEDYEHEHNKRIQAFIENVAHQIKTPLSRIAVSLDMINSEDMDACEQDMRIEECFLHIDGVNRLMKRLMDIGRLEAGKIVFKKENIRLDELFEDIAMEFRDSGSISIKLDDGRPERFKLHGDYEWLKEAFSNIIKNAFEHDNSQNPIEIICNREEEYFYITIKDNGKGFKEVDIPNLFDRFYLPEDAKANHNGIGLNFARLIIEGHFGSIHAANHEAGGAVFEIMLPVYKLKSEKIK